MSSSQGGRSDSCRLDILPHIRIPYIQVLCLFLSSTLCFYLVFSDSVAYQPRSTGDDLSLRQQRERERERPRDGRDGSFILLTQKLSEQSLVTEGIRVRFLLLNTSAVFTKSLKQMPMAHQLPLVQPGVGFKRASCAKAKQKPSDFSVIPPLPLIQWSSPCRPMMTVVMSEQKSSKRLWWGAERRGGGGVGGEESRE